MNHSDIRERPAGLRTLDSPQAMNPPALTCLPVPRCQLGENPLWHGGSQCLYWTDIEAGRIHRFHPASGTHEVIYQGIPVGGFTFQAAGDLLLFRVGDLALLHPDGGVEVLRAFTDAGLVRFNDVIADPEGRVFAGTIGTTDQSGGLYRIDPDGTITALWRGTGCSNGMGFSPDLKTFYWTCSTRRRIHQYDYDRATGALGPARLFHQAIPEEGIPDGLAVDQHGHVWSARWDGGAVVRHDPSGRIVDTIQLPVPKVASLCFGGTKLDKIYITTAGGRHDADGMEGAVFQFEPAAAGRHEFESRLRR